MMRVELEKRHPLWPEAHPETGEPLVSGTIQRLQAGQPVYGLPLGYPQRTVIDEMDDDGNILRSHERTDEELAAAIDAYNASPYKDGGPLWYTSGQATTHGAFETASGATCEGVHDGKAWEWTSWDVCTVHDQAKRRVGAGGR